MWFLSSALDLNESQLNHSLGKLLKFFCPPPPFFLVKKVLACLFLIFIYLFLVVALRIFDLCYGMRTLSCSMQDLVP